MAQLELEKVFIYTYLNIRVMVNIFVFLFFITLSIVFPYIACTFGAVTLTGIALVCCLFLFALFTRRRLLPVRRFLRLLFLVFVFLLALRFCHDSHSCSHIQATIVVVATIAAHVINV